MTTHTILAHRSDADIAHRPILITAIDRQRLEAIVRDAVASGSHRRDYLMALHRELARATVVDPAEIPNDIVTMNSAVRVRDLGTGEEETYTLVYPSFADSSNNCLSILAPIGTAILGCRVGEVVEWKVPSGVVQLKIEAVEFQPERAGRFDL